VLVAKAYLFRLFGDVGVGRLHLALSFSPFWFNYIGRFCLHFRLVLNLLKNEKKGPGIDWSHVLGQVVLGLPLGWAHMQQVCCEVSVI
jgi:hypothetical protein